MKKNKIEILGVLIDAVSKDQAVEIIENYIDEPKFNYATTPNPEMVVDAQKDEEFLEIIDRSDLAIADGFGLVLAAKILNKGPIEQICGSDLVWDILRLAEQKNKKVFLLGGLGKTAELTKKIVQQKLSGLKVVGAESGGRLIRQKGEWLIDSGLIERINKSRAEILIIARGHPWQEKFIHHFKDQLPEVRLAVGVGGTFDFISGKIKRAPKIMRKIKIEWLWRLIQEPRRAKRIYKAIIKFLYLVIKNKFMFFRKKVRVRFAPSPTGFLHIGGLRTALYNWLYAKNQKGTLVLRIEDTDQTRTVAGGEEDILKSLYWADVAPDEGVCLDANGEITQKGKYGPYRQSERLDIYKKHVNQLIDRDKAYYCFCTSERLQSMREEQIAHNQPPRYDGTCRNLTDDEIQSKLKAKIPYVVRLKVPEAGETAFDDLIHGEIKFNNSETDDQVLLKSDGFPTYHLANVVDDHLMKISHVIRGEEWLPSTPKHVLLYQAFGWKAPEFAHLPLLLNPDKSKLSKRQGDVAVKDYKNSGYLPEALTNFVALLGWNPKGDQEIYNRGELISHFKFNEINKSGAVFNREKLDWLNNHYIRQKDLNELTKLCLPYFIERQLISKEEAAENFAWLSKIVLMMRERAATLAEIVDLSTIFFKKVLEYNKEMLIWKKSTAEEAGRNLESLIEILHNIPKEDFISQNIEAEIVRWINEQGLKNGPVLWPMRVALSGEEKSPPPFELAEIFGKEETIKRIEQAIAKFQ